MSERDSQRWSEEELDSPLCSDEEIEEIGIASMLHDYFAWQEIYGVQAFLSRRRKAPALTRSDAGAWYDGAWDDGTKQEKSTESKKSKNNKRKNQD